MKARSKTITSPALSGTFGISFTSCLFAGVTVINSGIYPPWFSFTWILILFLVLVLPVILSSFPNTGEEQKLINNVVHFVRG